MENEKFIYEFTFLKNIKGEENKNKEFSFKDAYQQLKADKQKKKRLNTKCYDFKPFFSETDIDTFKKMCKLCIKFRVVSDLSLNRMYRLYKKILEVS